VLCYYYRAETRQDDKSCPNCGNEMSDQSIRPKSRFDPAIAQVIADSPLSLPEKVVWHLLTSYVPPLDRMFTKVAIEAVELVSVGQPDTMLSLPNGLTRAAHEVIDLLHLHAFVIAAEKDAS
jgi:hypothetical protein